MRACVSELREWRKEEKEGEREGDVAPGGVVAVVLAGTCTGRGERVRVCVRAYVRE